MVDTPMAVNQIPMTGQAARKKWRARELLKEAYWKMRRPKYPWAVAQVGKEVEDERTGISV